MKQTFPSMVKYIPEAAQGIASIEHVEVSEHASAMSALKGGTSYIPPGRYARLKLRGDTVMSDTRIEKITNCEVVNRAHGNVLLAGLGIGMILVPILKKREVKSVLVVEKYQDVIDIVAPHFPSRKLRIVCADIFDWTPEPSAKFDVIYFDIWPDQDTGNLPEMGRLHQRFKGCLNRNNPDRWMDSWARDLLRARLREERRMWP